MSNNNGNPVSVEVPQISDFVKPGDTFVIMKLDPVTKNAAVLASQDFTNPLSMMQFVVNTLSATIAAIIAAAEKENKIVRPTMIIRG